MKFIFSHSLDFKQKTYIEAILLNKLKLGATKTTFIKAISSLQDETKAFSEEQVKQLEQVFGQKITEQGKIESIGLPISMMLSKPLISLENAKKQVFKLAKSGFVAIEEKFDGERLQAK